MLIRFAVISAVSISVQSSICNSKATGGVKREKKLYVISSLVPDWIKQPIIEGRFITFGLPASIKDIIEDIPLPCKEIRKGRVQIANNPFAEGAERIAYYGRDVTYIGYGTMTSTYSTATTDTASTEGDNVTDIVLKKYKFAGTGSDLAARYEISNQLQKIAAYLANRFCDELRRKSPDTNMEIRFLKTKTLATETEPGVFTFWACERRFTDKDVFLRFSNNADYGMLESTAKENGVDIEYVKLVMAFSHWTYQVTKTKLMVVDLQGIVNQSRTGGRKLQLTDPAIHCKDITRYGPLNHGEEGMKNFFSHHECNDFCRLLSLKPPPEYPKAIYPIL